ncbi:MAG: metallophosphoesterase [Lachnospiraceae bacterium]|nr:metallophosphoesterase [Lachnospiraceae bacterium]
MYIYINSQFKVSHYNLSDPRVKKDVRLAVLADLHNCMCEDGGRQLFHAIDTEKPDVVIIVGDMVDARQRTDPESTMKVMKLIHESYPVIYGMGNHEKKLLAADSLHRERRLFLRGLKDAGLKILSDSYKYLDDTGIKVSCLDLPIWYFRRIEDPGLSTEQIREKLGDIDRTYYNILIAHDPQYFETYSDYGPDLVLSGHMHGGVIRLPYLGGFVSPKLKLFPRYDAGVFERNGTKMIISRGLGMHTIRVRVNNSPELVIVDIGRK